MVNINETKDTIEITLSSSDDHEEEEDNDERLDDALPSTLIPPAISSLSNSSTLLSLTSSSSLNDDDDDDDETPNSSNERSSDLLLFEESNLVENTSATCPASVHLWLLESGLMTTMKNTVKSITSTAAPNNNRCSEEYDKGCNKQKEGEEPHVTNAMNNTTRTNSSTTSEERSFRSDQSNSHTFSSAEIACELNTLTARTSTHTTRCNGQDETGTMSNKKLGFNMITFQKENKLKACSFFAMIKSYLSSSFLTKNLLPDDKIHIFSFQIFESIPAFRIFKFVIVTFLLLIAMYFLARLQVVNWEHDESYTPMTFVREDMNDVIVDTIAFAVVGRLYKRRGVDRLFPFIIPMTLSCICTSLVTSNVWFLQNSITWTNIRNEWPWELYVFAISFIVMILIILMLHIKFAIRDGTFGHCALEAIFLLCLFVVPHVPNSDFHFHHWYSFWIFGVLCNRDEWWSQVPMAISWSLYINGVSVYGRDGLYTR